MGWKEPLPFLERWNGRDNFLRCLCCVDQSSVTGVRHHLTTKQQKQLCLVPSKALCLQLAGPRRGTPHRHQRNSVSASPSVPSLPPPSLLSPSLLQRLHSTFPDNYIFGNGHSACCGANRRVNGLFPSTISNRAMPSCCSAEVQDTKGQGPCQGNRLLCEALLAQLLHGQ